MYYTYALYSETLDRLYIGQTQHLQTRINEHLRGFSKYTKRAKDRDEIYLTRGNAMKGKKKRNLNRSKMPINNLANLYCSISMAMPPVCKLQVKSIKL